MQRTLIRLFRYVPLGVLYGCMALVIPFYMLFGTGFGASYRFFRKRMGYPAVKSFFHVYLNEFEFGKVVLDRFAAFAGKKFHMEVPRMDLFQHSWHGEWRCHPPGRWCRKPRGPAHLSCTAPCQ